MKLKWHDDLTIGINEIGEFIREQKHPCESHMTR